MRILFATENYYPKLSGVPVVVKYLAEGLARKGYDVIVVTQSVKGTSDCEMINGVKIYRFPIWKDWIHTYRGNIAQYIDFVRQANADVNILECTECITTDVLLPYIKKIRGKVLLHSHGMSGFDSKFFSLKDNLKHTLGSTYNWFNSLIYFRWTLKKVIMNIDAFICLSEVDSGIDYVKKYANRYYILDNAADNMFYSTSIPDGVLSNYTKLKHKDYLVSCANYTVVKNQKDMLRQYALSDSCKYYSLVCIGSQETTYYKECQELAKSLNEKNDFCDIHLLCGVQRKDIPSIIKGASLYLVTSEWEQYSISIIEAMSQGVPFISTNVGNARLLPGGQVIDNTNQLFTTIDQILTNKKLYENYSQLGHKFAYTHCRIEPAVEKLETIIQSVIKM